MAVERAAWLLLGFIILAIIAGVSRFGPESIGGKIAVAVVVFIFVFVVIAVVNAMD